MGEYAPRANMSAVVPPTTTSVMIHPATVLAREFSYLLHPFLPTMPHPWWHQLDNV